MKVPLSWLKHHIDFHAKPTLATLATRLTAQGLEVESYYDAASDLQGFVVALITSVRKHPDADQLYLCRINIGTKEREVVCGAPNARVGLLTIYGKVGACVPKTGMLLQKRKIRGIISEGMLCSAYELNIGQHHDSIVDLHDLYGWTENPNTPNTCLLYTSPSPRDRTRSRMPSSA